MNSQGQAGAGILMAIVALIVGIGVGWYMAGSRATVAPALSPTPVSRVQITPGAQGAGITAAELDLNKAMRKLWEDHIAWTRMYLIAAAADADNADEVAGRLLKNQEDIGNAIKPYYGQEAGNKLTALLKEHITGAVDVIAAARKNDQAALAAADKKWYENANQIADFLSTANPNWPRAEMRAMMKEHLDLTKQEAVDILGKKFNEDIADYDKVHEQILEMADMLTEGIVKQFPDKF